MKSILLVIGTLLFSTSGFSFKSDSLGMAGDNLDLTAVMELFKNSDSVEDFENKLNSDKNEVNNLDLNNDGYVDYIRVIDYTDGKVHSLTLQVPYSDAEAQDVAVIEIENTDEKTSVAQIVGDEDLYGKDFIVEPQSDNEKTAANVNQWKPIRHLYSPTYVVWVSPYRHNHYPTWYRPWKPVVWKTYYARVNHHHAHYRRTPHHRCHNAHTYYYKHRKYSPAFHSHYHKHQEKQSGLNNQKSINKSGAKNKGNVNKSSAPVQGTQIIKQKKTQHSPAQRSSAGEPTKRPGGTKSKASTKPTRSRKKPGGGKH